MSPSSPWLAVRARRLSLRVDRRVPPVLALALLAMLAAMVVNIGVGEYPIAPLDVIARPTRLRPNARRSGPCP